MIIGSAVDKLTEESLVYDEQKWDLGPAPARVYRFDGEETLNIVVPRSLDTHMRGVDSFPIRDHALKQVCGRLGAVAWPGSAKSVPYDYIAACPPWIQAVNLNHWTHKAPDEREWFVRTYRDQARAVLTNRYSVLDTTTVLQWTAHALASKSDLGSWMINRHYLTPDTLTLDILFREVDTPGGAYGLGVRISNGEIGNRNVGVAPYVQRTSCTNSITWNEDAWRHPHSGDVRLLRSEFLIMLFRATEASVRLLDTLLEAEEKDIPNFNDVLDELAEERGWTQVFRDDVLVGSEGGESVAAMANGITYAAQRVTDEEVRDDLEMLAGEWLHFMMRPKVRVRAADQDDV